MEIDVLVAEIGSTTTVVNAFQDIETENPKFLGQGQASTTVLEGDVNIGINNAVKVLEKNINASNITYKQMLATSSAAGGLKMSVHGLVYDMTVRAAREAALGAGANLSFATSGKLSNRDLEKILKTKPNIILIAGGVDYGEKETAIYNSECIASLEIDVPVIYAGNKACADDVYDIFNEQGKSHLLKVVENVYPKVDVLNVGPVRNVIQDVFELHITHAPGMESVRDTVNGTIMPTPAAVMEASRHLRENIGDLMTIDVGGATTDIHSVTDGSEAIANIMLFPEPTAKRTVEGDLGVYVNMHSILDKMGYEEVSKKLTKGVSIDTLIKDFKPIPDTEHLIEFVEILTQYAVDVSLSRHAGEIKSVFDYSGKKTVAMGKDLTAIKWIIGTGGALTRLPKRVSILESIIEKSKSTTSMYPRAYAQVLIDNDYIFASLGVLSKTYPNAALILMRNSLRIN